MEVEQYMTIVLCRNCFLIQKTMMNLKFAIEKQPVYRKKFWNQFWNSETFYFHIQMELDQYMSTTLQRSWFFCSKSMIKL